MPAITVGFPEFEMRLDQIRRRINFLLVVDVVCVAGTALLLVATSIAIAAFTLPVASFAWVLRTAVVVAAAVVIAAAWHLRAKWLDLYEAALLLDRKAAMEARIATMLAHPRSDSTSPMRSLLLWQIFDLAPRWDIERIAPRSLRRSAIALLAAFAIFTLASLLVPDIEQTPPPELAASGARAASAEALKPATGRQQIGSGSQGTGDQHAAASARGVERPAKAGDATKRSDDAQNTGTAGQTEPAGSDATATADGMREKPLGAHDEPRAPRPGDLKSIAPPVAGAEPPLVRQPAVPSRPPDPLAGKNAASPARAQGKKSGAPGGSKSTTDNPQKGRAAGSRGLLSDKAATALAAKGAAKPMVIQLKAFATSPVEQLEPQGGENGSASAESADQRSAPIPVAKEQRDDSLLQRSVVSRAHQTLLRELFTPRLSTDLFEPGTAPSRSSPSATR